MAHARTEQWVADGHENHRKVVAHKGNHGG